ncbi:MAG: DUF4190 domain-containing protein [bacterium]|nr:DUF4190 domain-containing protein [bacterium]
MTLKKGLAIASFVLGLFFWFPLFGIICTGLALIFGINSLVNHHRNPKEYGGTVFSILGIMLGIVGLLLPIILPILLILIDELRISRFLYESGLLEIIWPMYGITIMFFLLIFAILGSTKLKTFTKSIIALTSSFSISIILVLLHATGSYPMGYSIVEIIVRSFELTHPVIGNFIFALLPLSLILRKKAFFISQIALIFAILISLFILFSPSILGLIAALLIGTTLAVFIFPVVILVFQYNHLLKKINPAIFKIISIIALLLFAFRLISSPLSFMDIVSSSGPESAILSLVGLLVGVVIWSIFTIRLFRNPDFYKIKTDREN